ncbi:MAG: alcohol dehydrogenase catalytic domain-containing protein [candidate division WOR-3 bacterium]|nr:alcohol dehydrogenase catalytic domain-containing protein [candidate division WOR-3 bacterium]MCX7948087.1 alcohol dehydrogenase catalytic domain-containing protein [candidate division WOR-3 bacterium]MDW8150975.1 alcohol dehydrogenase catalytic domain-containing protein [candidate division WOR-3 bacterium]
MKAVIINNFGDIDVLELKNIQEPKISSSEVLVRIKAVSINHIDIWIRKGINIRPNLPHILGADISGVVVDKGSDVVDIEIGDEVVLSPAVSCNLCYQCMSGNDNFCKNYSILGEHVWGGYREYINIRREFVFKKPKNLNFIESASFPLTFLTAYNALIRRGQIERDSIILIMSAGSGVGSSSIQIAKKLLNAYIITTVGSDEKIQRAYEIGADFVINWKKQDISSVIKEKFGKIDAVLDHTGKMHINNLIKIVKNGGKIITYGATSGHMAEIDLRHIFYRQISIIGSTMGKRADIFEIIKYFENGVFKPIVYKVLPIEEIKKAHSMIESGEVFGKVVIEL